MPEIKANPIGGPLAKTIGEQINDLFYCANQRITEDIATYKIAGWDNRNNVAECSRIEGILFRLCGEKQNLKNLESAILDIVG